MIRLEECPNCESEEENLTLGYYRKGTVNVTIASKENVKKI